MSELPAHVALERTKGAKKIAADRIIAALKAVRA